jgi:aldose 1-epimerase
MSVNVSSSIYGVYKGQQIQKFCITQAQGIEVCIINYGATIISILTPNKDGTLEDIVLGFDCLEGYTAASQDYMGSICGRFANRISNGKFTLQGVDFHLPKNNNNNTLHGGFNGFDKAIWVTSILPENNGISMQYISKDGEEGFAGNLNVTVIYKVVNNELHIEYIAKTDKPTPVNITNHSYFNLSAGSEKDVLNHQLYIAANNYLEVNEALVPSGKLLPVYNSIMDFRTAKDIKKDIETTKGFDNCWAINNANNTLQHAATVTHKKSGRAVKVFTTQPGIQVYTGNHLHQKMLHTKSKIGYNKFSGLCLETQHFPDSPNISSFPSTILLPNNIYQHKTIYSFYCI